MALASLHLALPRLPTLRFSRFLKITAAAFCLAATSTMLLASDFELQLRSMHSSDESSRGPWEVETRQVNWDSQQTAIIVCDFWDYHHCLNAVRRMEQFGPRLNQVLAEARRKGATIIHSPSDCMPAYESHPARSRAMQAPTTPYPVPETPFWCSQIPTEEAAVYPIDQSDGGEDDDPEEHQKWAAKLKELGRNPSMPWKKQSDMITIDDQSDYISDRGDEVWNILKDRKIRHVILVGVHTNMCVIGRPFGLRRMVANGFETVLMRDMTDCMYNPKRWPFVDHVTGNQLVISHIEKFVCPTMTSDQILGGEPFRFSPLPKFQSALTTSLSSNAYWRLINLQNQPDITTWPREPREDNTVRVEAGQQLWLRCTLYLPASGKSSHALVLGQKLEGVRGWLNGKPLTLDDPTPSRFTVPQDSIVENDTNLLVIQVTGTKTRWRELPTWNFENESIPLERWHYRFGDDESWSNIPLPAKFGMGPDVFHALAKPSINTRN